MENEASLFIVQHKDMPQGQFDLHSTNREMRNGGMVPAEKTLKYVSVDGSLADRFAAMGIAMHEISRGRNAILFISPGDEVIF